MRTWVYWEGDMPPIIEACVESIHRYCDDAELLTKKDVPTDVLRRCEGLGHARRADVIRLWLLEREGGMWIDADTIMLRRPTEAYDAAEVHDFVAFHNGRGKNRVPNSVFCTRKNGVFIRAAMEAQRVVLEKRRAQGYTALGANIFTRLWQTNKYDVLRLPRKWMFKTNKHRDHAKRGGDVKWELDEDVYWPGAMGYHLTSVTTKAVQHMSRERLCLLKTFLGFLLRKADRVPRPDRAQALLKHIPDDRPFKFVEVGVNKGILPTIICQQRPLVEYWCVDPWQAWPEDSTYAATKDSNASRSQAWFDECLASLLRRAEYFQDRVHIKRKTSQMAHGEFANGYLDGVFLDEEHSYDAVIRGWGEWRPKIRPGGFIAVHDVGHKRWPDTQRACEELHDSWHKEVNKTWVAYPS